MSTIITNPSLHPSIKNNHFSYNPKLPKEGQADVLPGISFDNLKVSKPTIEASQLNKVMQSKQDMIQDIYKTAQDIGIKDITDRDILVAMHEGGSVLVDYIV